MGAKLCPKIILEGTRLTRKTEIAFALNEHPRVVGPRGTNRSRTVLERSRLPQPCGVADVDLM